MSLLSDGMQMRVTDVQELKTMFRLADTNITIYIFTNSFNEELMIKMASTGPGHSYVIKRLKI